MSDLCKPGQNNILSALPKDEYERLAPHLELVQVKVGECLHESGGYLRYAYFPVTCIVSLICILENGASSEIAIVGNEGVIGVAIFMSRANMPNQAVALSTGCAYRLLRQPLIQEFNRIGMMSRLLLRYTQALIIQMAQTAACNRHHTIDQQLCNWILLNLDRQFGQELEVTQELIGNMLGVRRESVTQVAVTLQRAGLIDYSRGRIKVLDRPGLEERACECYRVIKTEYDRLLSWQTRKESLPPQIRIVDSANKSCLFCP